MLNSGFSDRQLREKKTVAFLFETWWKGKQHSNGARRGENTQTVYSVSFIAEWSYEFVNTFRGFHCFDSELIQIKQMPVSWNLHALIF